MIKRRRQTWGRARTIEVNSVKRKLVVAATLLLFVSLASGQEVRPLEPTQNPDAPYRLFGTRNVYTFLKLDTREGRIWQVQWGEEDSRLTVPINLKPLVSDGKAGRFTLYPTTNVYTFVLLDQETGDTWHVQWGKFDDRFIARIKDLMPPDGSPERTPEE
jgi:hypothetical protein